MAQDDTIQNSDWHALQAEEVLSHLKVEDKGLTSAQVEERLAKYGQNQL